MDSILQVSIVIISYNTIDMTLECIRSVYEQTKDLAFELVVLDNDSKDGSAQKIAENFPNVNLIISKENLGFARANNFAAELIKGKYLLLLNPDTVVLDAAIEKIYAFARKNDVHQVYGGRTVFGDYSLNPTSCWKRPTIWSLFCYSTGLASIFRRNRLLDPESYGPWGRDSVREVDIVTGCFLMIEKPLWDQLGGFDPQFFMYGEDADLCLRARQHGARPIITPDATIVHYGGASEKVRADKMVRLLRAKKQLIKKHWSSIACWLGLELLRFSVLSRLLACNSFFYLGNKGAHDKAVQWREVWQRRVEWYGSGK
jgi:GT2 family glycosyltransferase